VTDTADRTGSTGIQLGRGEPVFVLAPARSFSTVTVAILGGHPDIYGLPELLIFSAPTVGDLLSADRDPSAPRTFVERSRTGILRAVAQLHDNSQSDQAIQLASNWLVQRADWSTTRLLDHLVALAHPRVAVEKSPGTVRTVERLNACVAAYPKARYIHLTRHPVTTQHSMQEHYRPLPGNSNRSRLIAECASAWYITHCRIIAKVAQLPDEQWIRVRAEDLLREPHESLSRLLKWLGLPEDDQIVTRMLQTENWEFAGRGPSGQLWGGDWKFMMSPAIRQIPAPEPVSFDPSWGLHPEMCRRMTLLADYLGY
jgi:Sulfotransferase family